MHGCEVSHMELGTGMRIITPPFAMRLCGYSGRSTPFECVKEDLYLRVHLLRDQETRLLFLYGDVLSWDPGFVQKARPFLNELTGIDEDHIFLTATHNHCGPATGSVFAMLTVQATEDYESFLLSQMREAVLQAIDNLEPVVLYRYTGSSALSVYRRKWEKGHVQMMPNYCIPVDQTLTMLDFQRMDGTSKALGIHYACHANVCGENVVQPDYPGILLRMIDAERPGCLSFFWQGCAGDVRPNCVVGSQFQRMTYKDAVFFATQLKQDCDRTLHTTGERINGPLYACRRTVMLPRNDGITPERAYVMMNSNDDAARRRGAAMKAQGFPTGSLLELGCFCLGEGLYACTFNGEMVHAYASMVKKAQPQALAIGYTNGTIGYICTAQQIKAGGYEPCESVRTSALCGPLSEAAENIIRIEIERICDEMKQVIAKRGVH